MEEEAFFILITKTVNFINSVLKSFRVHMPLS